ncbi:8076_t:CDS:2 [Gigaspora margarita]|uniref:8076_t:CDS:1 n=1 Tax=Gigaspora margarita TaxID=4874 RepID=A0ABN7VKV8_GIGMA|nr:8076_t:CDS:2 [Gigaspora margarita]
MLGLGKVFNQKTADALKRLNLFTMAQLISDRRNRKLTPEYVISGYNSLALSIAFPVVSLDKRKKELVLVENKDDNRKIFKIVQKEKMIRKVDEENEKRISKKLKSELPTNSLNKSLFQGLLPIECLEIELLKKQKLSKALELVLQSLMRNIESNEQEFFFYTDGSLQLQKEDQIGSSTKMGLGWLQLSKDKSYIVDEGFARIRDWLSFTRPELAAIWLVVLLASSGTKLTIYSDSMVAINAVTSINRSLAFSQFIKLENFT